MRQDWRRLTGTSAPPPFPGGHFRRLWINKRVQTAWHHWMDLPGQTGRFQENRRMFRFQVPRHRHETPPLPKALRRRAARSCALLAICAARRDSTDSQQRYRRRIWAWVSSGFCPKPQMAGTKRRSWLSNRGAPKQDGGQQPTQIRGMIRRGTKVASGERSASEAPVEQHTTAAHAWARAQQEKSWFQAASVAAQVQFLLLRASGRKSTATAQLQGSYQNCAEPVQQAEELGAPSLRRLCFIFLG